MVRPDRSRRVPVAEDVSLHVLEWEGEGPPFVLLHGLASNARLWDGVATGLAAAGHRVVSVDQRGHGRSDKPDGGYDLTTVTDDLSALLEVLALERPVVVGQSWGANVAIEFAARFPGVATAVGCIDGGIIDLRRQFADWEACARALRPPALVGAPLTDIEQMIRDAHPDWPESGIQATLACFEVRDDGTVAPWLDLERHLRVLRGLWDHRPLEWLPAVREPVLLVVAAQGSDTDDREAKREAVEAALDLLEAAEAEWVVGDHDLHAQHPIAVAKHLRRLAARAVEPR